MNAKVYVTLKKGVLDPQGKAVERSLAKLGFPDVKGVRVGRFIAMAIEAPSRDEAKTRVDAMSLSGRNGDIFNVKELHLTAQ